jgi:hypothetical protein
MAPVQARAPHSYALANRRRREEDANGYTDIRALHGGAMVDSVPRPAPQTLKARSAHDVRFSAIWVIESPQAVWREGA